MRYAIYARYSSDLQNASSIEDQIRICRERIEQTGGVVIETYMDAAISGAHLINRPGLRSLLDDARHGAFDAVMAEAMDRISRDQEDIAGIYKRLSHQDIKMVTLSEGVISELHIGLKGTMNALFLKDMAAKVRRGMRGALEAGRIASGLCYGYKVLLSIEGNELQRGRRAIIPEQAKVIRRIFTEYAAGRSPRAIAAGLNADGIPGPRGGIWRASAINGSKARKNGILYNDMYVGRIVFNRQTFRKDPETGRRIGRKNPESEWKAFDFPDLRIVSDELWHKVQAIKDDKTHIPFNTQPRAKYVFSGLVRCGICQGSFTIKSKNLLRCTTRHEGGKDACINGHSLRADDLEKRLLDGLEGQMLQNEAIERFAKTFMAERARINKEKANTAKAIERELGAAESKIKRIIDAITDGTDSKAMRQQLMELESRADQLRRVIAKQKRNDNNVIEFYPNLAEIYRKKISALRAALDCEGPKKNAGQMALRSLVHEIRVIPDKKGRPGLELHGIVPALLAFAQNKDAEWQSEKLCLQLVAAECNSLHSHNHIYALAPKIKALQGGWQSGYIFKIAI